MRAYSLAAYILARACTVAPTVNSSCSHRFRYYRLHVRIRDPGLETAHMSNRSKSHHKAGAPLGSKEYVDQFVSEKITQWRDELLQLADIAKSQPHAAYTDFTHGYIHKFSYLYRILPDIEHLSKLSKTAFVLT